MLCRLRKNGNSWSAIIPIDIARPFIESGEIEIEIIGASEKIIPEILKPSEDTEAKKEKIDALRELITTVENKPVEKSEPIYPQKQYQSYDPRYNPNTGFEEDSIQVE